MSKEMEKEQLLMMIEQIRLDHPRLSARQMYKLIKPVYIGRDKFEELCFNNGYKLQTKRNRQRTTNSLGVRRFENLIKEKKFTDVNQALVSDITFYRIEERFCYLTFIMDIYSRKILGYGVSEDLLTENTTVPALKMALRNRRVQDVGGLILHSDGGGQYYSKQFLKLTESNQILNSMCDNVYENSHAERLNGTIKNDYLYPYAPDSVQNLKKMLKRAVELYNNERPHSALGGLSPTDFEKSLKFSTNSELLTKRKKVTKKEKVNYYDKNIN
jgi:transposase InsO family protein